MRDACIACPTHYTHWVIAYQDGSFQGHPGPGPGGKRIHPKVRGLENARVYNSQSTARMSMAHKFGAVKPLQVELKDK